MATLEDRLQTVMDYVEAWTGRTTYEADSGFTQPATPYCTVKLILENDYDFDVADDIDGFNQTVRGLTRLDYSIQAIGGDAAAGTSANKVLHRLLSSFKADLPREALEREEMGILSIGDVIDISTEVGGEIEDRAALTIGLSASIEETFDFETATTIGVEVDPGMDPPNNLTIPDEPDCPV